MTTETHQTGATPGAELSPIPAGVYWSHEGENFYSMTEKTGMGNEFFKKWRSRISEFPTDLDLQPAHSEREILALDIVRASRANGSYMNMDEGMVIAGALIAKGYARKPEALRVPQ